MIEDSKVIKVREMSLQSKYQIFDMIKNIKDRTAIHDEKGQKICYLC